MISPARYRRVISLPPQILLPTLSAGRLHCRGEDRLGGWADHLCGGRKFPGQIGKPSRDIGRVFGADLAYDAQIWHMTGRAHSGGSARWLAVCLAGFAVAKVVTAAVLSILSRLVVAGCARGVRCHQQPDGRYVCRLRCESWPGTVPGTGRVAVRGRWLGSRDDGGLRA